MGMLIYLGTKSPPPLKTIAIDPHHPQPPIEGDGRSEQSNINCMESHEQSVITLP